MGGEVPVVQGRVGAQVGEVAKSRGRSRRGGEVRVVQRDAGAQVGEVEKSSGWEKWHGCEVPGVRQKGGIENESDTGEGGGAGREAR